MKDKGSFADIPAADYSLIEQALRHFEIFLQKETARAFVDFIKSPAIAETFWRHGFVASPSK
jgi:hypothetical protein